jgi:hypothetical protein
MVIKNLSIILVNDNIAIGYKKGGAYFIFQKMQAACSSSGFSSGNMKYY